MYWKGFRKAIFEDNYPRSQGDCYSVKKMLGGHGFKSQSSLNKSIKSAVKTLLGRGAEVEGNRKVPPNMTHREDFAARAEIYYEGPPLYRTAQTRWGDAWSDEAYPTKEPLFVDGSGDELFADAKDYNWMCFVQSR